MNSEKSIFFAAIDRDDVDERVAYLKEACAGDEQLFVAVSNLLREHERKDNPVDRPLAMAMLPTPLIDTAPELSTDSRFPPGTMIGPYKLREQVGEGGFGLVFVADQLQPVRRRVALKIIKPGMESKEILARFEAERQALAMMDHENIARVFDAGVTDSGQSYFVMELVRGVPLNEFCDNHRLDTASRLRLFISICNAVQHAHQKGIIHRDLKPNNVLVTLRDGQPVAKVIDFGVVKSVGQNLTDKTIYTRLAAMVGTPAYMSPEQAEMSEGDVDTRSDIYSLGVLLYELLTGSPPFAVSRLNQVGFDELRRIIREEEPPRPSRMLTTLGAESMSALSSNRRTIPTQLTSTIRGDLDWIVMKALQKDRNRRYASAAAMADDISRHLNQKTIEARPPTAFYQFSKFARRNKAILTTISLVGAALIIGTAVSVWQALVAVEAMKQARISETEAHESRENLQQFNDRLKRANVLLASGHAYVEAGNWSEAHAAFTEATEIQPEYFHVWMQRGSMYAKLGLWELAAADYAKAIELGSPVDGAEYIGVPQLFLFTNNMPAYEKLSDELTRSNKGATSTKLRGQLIGELSQQTAKKVAEIAEDLIDDRPNATLTSIPNRTSRMPLGVKLYLAGWAHFQAGNYERAIVRLEQSNTDGPSWPGSGIGYPLIAMSHEKLGRRDEAIAALEKSNAALDKWLNESVDVRQGVPPMPWFGWIEYLIHHRKAEQMIRGQIPPTDPRFAIQKAAAMAAIR